MILISPAQNLQMRKKGARSRGQGSTDGWARNPVGSRWRVTTPGADAPPLLNQRLWRALTAR